jgi:hypothetical protein
MLVESANVPLRLARYDGPSPASRRLAGGHGAVLFLPLADNDTLVMLDSLAHGRPVVNGDSGFVPRPFDRAQELFAYGVDAEGLRFLRAVGVTNVVWGANAEGLRAKAAGLAGLAPAAVVDHERVDAVDPGPQAAAVRPGDPVATRWTPSGLVLTLSEPREISRVAFELSDAPWVDRPRVEASLDGATFEPVEAGASLADATVSLYRDPRHGRGEVRFAPRDALFLRLDPSLPARPGALEVAR